MWRAIGVIVCAVLGLASAIGVGHAGPWLEKQRLSWFEIRRSASSTSVVDQRGERHVIMLEEPGHFACTVGFGEVPPPTDSFQRKSYPYWASPQVVLRSPGYVMPGGWNRWTVRGWPLFASYGQADDPFSTAPTGIDSLVQSHYWWPGMAANAAFFGAIWWLLWRTPGTMKRFSRRRRGRCMGCGYDLRGVDPARDQPLCPECGRAIATRASPKSLPRKDSPVEPEIGAGLSR
jgi:hypothetical protein